MKTKDDTLTQVMETAAKWIVSNPGGLQPKDVEVQLSIAHSLVAISKILLLDRSDRTRD